MGIADARGPANEGRDASSLFTGKKTGQDWHDVNFVRIGRGAHNGWFGAFTSRYKLILAPGAPAALFDLERDPFELRNVINLPEHRDTIRQLGKELKDYATSITTHLWAQPPFGPICRGPSRGTPHTPPPGAMARRRQTTTIDTNFSKEMKTGQSFHFSSEMVALHRFFLTSIFLRDFLAHGASFLHKTNTGRSRCLHPEFYNHACAQRIQGHGPCIQLGKQVPSVSRAQSPNRLTAQKAGSGSRLSTSGTGTVRGHAR